MKLGDQRNTFEGQAIYYASDSRSPQENYRVLLNSKNLDKFLCMIRRIKRLNI